MLRSISIKNLAVVESAEVEFEAGLTVLSGETGVGKSILLDAVDLLLGGRSSSDVVRTGETATVLQARFQTDGNSVTLKREISSNGRSRAFIDGVPAASSTLRALAPALVEIQGQHEHFALLDPTSHLGVLDAFASHPDQTDAVAGRWVAYREAHTRLDRSRLDAHERQRRLDLIARELGEIDAVNPRAGEAEDLTAHRAVLVHADRIQRLSENGHAALYANDGSVMAGLSAVWKAVAELAELDPEFVAHADARTGIKAQLEDLATALRNAASRMEGATGQLEAVEDRLAALERLQRRYGPSVDDVLLRAERHREEQRLLASPEGEAGALAQALDLARNGYIEEARRLSRLRREAAPRFAGELERMLHQLAMEHSRIEVRFNERPVAEEEWSGQGLDRVELLLSANLGESPRPLAKVISGGELSRAVLALRTLSASTCEGRTLIFDEVDAGIGGRTADVVGRCLRDLAERFQVICITHVPQIAACADHQLRVLKHTQNGRTVSSIERLDEAGRRNEIARMLAGATVTPQALLAAGELLDAARRTPDGKPESESKHRTKEKA
ncbi:MAG: DNA repair protein RecN [Vicinamibacterales bacterium]